jgi:hypothetical protein
LSSHLLAECPNVTILVLDVDRDAAFIQQLCPWQREIVDPSVATIMNTLRHAVLMPCSTEEEEETSK